MTYLPNYDANIVWDDDCFSPSANAVLTLKDGSTYEIHREDYRSLVPVKNGPLFYGKRVYRVGGKEYESFEDLMKDLSMSKIGAV